MVPARPRRKPPKKGTSLTPLPPIRDAGSLETAFAALRAADAALIDRLVREAGPPPLRLREGGLKGLA